MCSTQRCRDRARRGSAGFTLVEVLVTLVITTILATVIFQVVRANSEFVRMQSAREEVQQNARAALALISSDLRSIPPAAIAGMASDSVRIRLPRSFGVLCNTVTADSTTAWVIFPSDGFPSNFGYNQPGWGVAIEQTVVPTQPSGSWRFVSQVGQSSSSANPCNNIQPSPTSRHLRVGFTAPSGSFVSAPSALLPGTSVLVYEEVKYDVSASTSAGIPGTWIRRSAGYSAGQPNMQPMAGPVPAVGALSFTYLGSDGVTPAASPADVRRIRIRVIAESRSQGVRQGKRGPMELDTATTEVFVRN